MRTVWHEPIDDFNKRQIEYYEWISTLPKCSDCGEPIEDEYYYEVDGKIYCDRCIESKRKYLE